MPLLGLIVLVTIIAISLIPFIDNNNNSILFSNTAKGELYVLKPTVTQIDIPKPPLSSHGYYKYSIVSDIVNATTTLISTYGYPGVFVAALLENLFPPIPSEVIFPLAGFTANSKNLGLVEGAFGMAIMGAAGSTVGAIIIYLISRKIGRAIVLKLGKYVGLGEKELKKTETWFERHGQSAVFFGRMAPGLREIISIPAGIQKMNLFTFLVFTFAGSLVWSVSLTLVGFYIGEAWNRFYDKYSFVFDIVAGAIVIGIIAVLVFRYFKNKRKDKRNNL
jgi:membrane protein DedA with SNARE-associated domain